MRSSEGDIQPRESSDFQGKLEPSFAAGIPLSDVEADPFDGSNQLNIQVNPQPRGGGGPSSGGEVQIPRGHKGAGHKVIEFLFGNKLRTITTSAVIATGAVVGTVAADRAGAFDPNTDEPGIVGAPTPGTTEHSPQPTIQQSSPTAEATPTAEPTKKPEGIISYEIYSKKDYDGLSLSVPVEMTKPYISEGKYRTSGLDVEMPGIENMYLDESFNDESGTVEEKTREAIYILLHKGYMLSNPDSGVSLEQFIADAEQGKESGAAPKYEFKRKGTGQKDIIINEQTTIEFMHVPKNLNGYAQPNMGGALASENLDNNVVRLGSWTANGAGLAPQYNVSGAALQMGKYSSTNAFVSAMAILVVYPDMYTTQGNLSPDQLENITEVFGLVDQLLYRGDLQKSPDGAIKATPKITQ